MSYHIVKSICIDEKEGKVYITGADNNVYPRTPRKWDCPSLGDLLVEEGREAVELALFKEYENGNLQGSATKYPGLVKVLRAMPEYEQFDWRGEDYAESRRLRETPEFEALLLRVLRSKLPKRLVLKDGMTIKTEAPQRFRNGAEGQYFEVCKRHRQTRFILLYQNPLGTWVKDTMFYYIIKGDNLTGATEVPSPIQKKAI